MKYSAEGEQRSPPVHQTRTTVPFDWKDTRDSPAAGWLHFDDTARQPNSVPTLGLHRLYFRVMVIPGFPDVFLESRQHPDMSTPMR